MTIKHEGSLTLTRIYQPDEDKMLRALSLVLRSKDPPADQRQIKNETTSGKLAGNALVVSEATTRPITGETRNQPHDLRQR